MKQKVRLSTYSLVITLISMIVLIAVTVMEMKRGQDAVGYVFAGMLVFISLMALFYSPVSVSVDERDLRINRVLRSTVIPIADIESVKMCAPTMGARRVCGSGGWFGYWGWFTEGDTGRYFAYFGRSSDCFLVRLKNGRRYMLGCDNPGAVVAYVEEKLK